MVNMCVRSMSVSSADDSSSQTAPALPTWSHIHVDKVING